TACARSCARSACPRRSRLDHPMPLVPSRRLVLLALAPLALAIATVLQPSVLPLMLATDAAVLLAMLVDAHLARRPAVVVERAVSPVLSIGRPNPVRLHLRSTSRRRLAAAVTDDRPPELAADGLPARAELPPHGRATILYHLRPARRGAVVLGDHHVRYPSPLGLWQRQLRLTAR